MSLRHSGQRLVDGAFATAGLENFALIVFIGRTIKK
jgi:hypothetical protein